MAEQIHRQAATVQRRDQASVSGFVLTEINTRFLWSIQADNRQDLVEFTQAIFAEKAQFGNMLTRDSLRLLQLWPSKAYLLYDHPALPDPLQEFSSMLTDISHGMSELSLVSDQSLDFLNHHTSVNLQDPRIADSRSVRCLLGQYPVIIWWDQISDIRLLIDRSYAQSLRDYLNHLLQRWDQVSQ